MNDLANVSASLCLVGQLCSVLCFEFQPCTLPLCDLFMPVRAVCALCQTIVLVLSLWYSHFLQSEKFGLFGWPVGLSSALGMFDVAACTVCSFVHETVSSHKRLFPFYMGTLELPVSS